MRSLPDLHRLQIFAAVGSTLSFSRAAAELGIAQPAVSRAIKALEDELRFKLLDRSTRHVALTLAGKVLLENAREAFSQIEYSVRAAKQTALGNAGTLLMAYSVLAAHGPMAELIVQFNGKRPEVRTELFVLSSREQIDALARGSIDCGFLLSVACPNPATHFVLSRERMVLLVSRFDPLAARSQIELRELAQRPFVLGRPTRWATFRSIVDSVCVQAGFLPTVVEEADDIPVLLRRISMRRGVSLHGASIRGNLPPDIVSIPISDEYAAFEISVAWQNENPAPLVNEFIESARQFAHNKSKR